MKTVLVLLASGDSRRFHGNKLLHQMDGKCMYRHLADTVAACSDALFIRKIVVTQYQEIAADLGTLGYEVIENHESHLGISHTIRLALAAIRQEDADAACFAVCDQPYLTSRTLESFLQGWAVSGKGLGCLKAGEQLGNPAVFAAGYFPELLELSGDAGGKKVIRRHLNDLWTWAASARELQDFDERI